MFCSKCGSEIKDGAKFCAVCGAAAPKQKQQTDIQKTGYTGRITLCPDGKYRWMYSVNLFTDPTFFFLVWKIFFFILLGVFAVTFIVDWVEWGFGHSVMNNLKFYGIILLGMTALVAVGYLIYAAIMGGKYTVLFEMDENGVNHRQIRSQAKKAQIIGELTALAGALAGKPSVVGIGLTSQRSEMRTDFSIVRKVKAYPRRRLIKVNGLLEHNQVYAQKEDFEFVKDYIVSHCEKLKKK